MAATSKFEGNIMDVIALVDSRHDFEDTSKDTALKIREGDQENLDCLQNFSNNIQRLVLFGDDANAENISKRLTSSCRGNLVMKGSPENEFLKYVEYNCGIPYTPANFTVDTLTAWNGAGGGGAVISEGWDGFTIRGGDGSAWAAPWGQRVAQRGNYGRGVRKILVRGGAIAVAAYPSNADMRRAVRAIAASQEPGPVLPEVRARARTGFGAAEVASIETSIQAYNTYHRQIAEALGYNPDTGPIPVIVDTTKTLHRSAYPYFIICRNKECMTDPSPTSSMTFEHLAEEIGEAVRNYTITGVNYRVSRTNQDPEIQYTTFIEGVPFNTPYQFGAAGIKPNAIEICKGNIKDAIADIIKNSEADFAAGAPRRRNIDEYQNLPLPPGQGPVIARLTRLFDNDCDVYANLSYRNPPVTPESQNRIAVCYIAKRAGDQLQAESCRQPWIPLPGQEQFPAPNAPIHYRITHRNAYQPEVECNADMVINNCVFWTYDRVAAIYAVLRGITTVLQLPTKDVVIYKNNAYDATRTTGIPTRPAAGGRMHIPRQIKTKGGYMCTQSQVQRDIFGQTFIGRALTAAEATEVQRRFSRSRPVSDVCFYNILSYLSDYKDLRYDAFTLLNIINYYLDTQIYGLNYINNPLLARTIKELELSIDNVIGRPAIGAAPNLLQNADRNRIVYITRPDQAELEIKWVGGGNNTVRIMWLQMGSRDKNILGVGGILSTIAVVDNNVRDFFKYLYGTSIAEIGQLAQEPPQLALPAPPVVYREAFPGEYAGGSLDFYNSWSELQKSFSLQSANTLFIQFLELLSLCENQYFIQRDSADNFYVYNPIPVRHGGHTQIEMMSFLDKLTNEYNSRKTNPSKLEPLLKCFIYFPYLLERTGLQGILTDIKEYISVWFKYENIMSKDIEPDEETETLFSSIITMSSKMTQNVQSNLSPVYEKCADYLHTIFPHGYFVIKYNEIKSINSSNKGRANSKPKLVTKNKFNNATNMNKLINNMKRLSVKPKIQRPGPAPASLTSRTHIFGGKHLTKKKRKNKRKTHKKRKY